jgi:hypothetical protein
MTMKKKLISAAIFSMPLAALAGPAEDFSNVITAKEWEELFDISATVTASCVEKIWTDRQDLVNGVKQIVKDIGGGAVEVTAEFGTSLAMKRNYPNLCHVMPKEVLQNISVESERNERPCIINSPFGCIKHESRTYKTYSYYWPKYFVEVSDKGNDPHPAFAASNKLYTANRKIANSLDSLIDVKGPYTLAAKVMAGAGLVNTLTSTYMGEGVNLKVSGQELGEASKSAILTPFEKLRLRANHEANQPSYEANIWPVGLSKTIAERFSVCGDGDHDTDEGGFGWPVPGVAMTCPVAMARDSWSYWDSGFVDYLNPNAIRGIVTASNPLQCAADNFASIAFDEYGSKAFGQNLGSAAGNSQKEGKINGLPSMFQGLRYCSFPIMGDTEAIYRQYSQLADSFKGPWCTLWGPMVPRNSTETFQNDYSYVNAALKFKTLAHDIFGVPRGKKERWSLAYPWEDSPQSFLGSYAGDLAKTLGIDKNSEIYKKYFAEGTVGRSKMLMIPGDPRLIDSKLSPIAELLTVENAANLAKEVAYLASLNTAATEAEKQAIDAMKKAYGVKGPSSSKEVLAEHEKELKQAEKDTALLGKEPIYEFDTFCHVAAENKGTIVGAANNRYPVAFQGNISGSPYDFYPSTNQGQCFSVELGGCISRDTWGNCKNKRDGQYIWYRKAKIVGYRDVQNPAIYQVQDGADCRVVENSSTPNTKFVKAVCSDKVVKVGNQDTREVVERPDVNAPEKLFNDTPEAAKEVGLAAKTATWVGAEIARAKYENLSGKSMLPGKKKVYTIYEQVTCEPKSYVADLGMGIKKYGKCEEAVKFEVRKFIQTRILRKACDASFLFNSPLGKPFK